MKTTLIVLLGSLFSYFIPHLLNLNMWSSCQLTIDNWACLIFMWAEDTNIVDSVYIFLVSIFVIIFCNLFASLGILSFSSECIGWAAHEPWHHIGSQVVHCYPKYVSDNGVNFFVFVLIQQVSLPLWINVCVVRQADQSVFWQKLSLSVWRVTELWVEVIQGLVSTARPCVWSQCHVVIM